MKTINIYGDNRLAHHTKIREACRGIIVRDGNILLSYASKIDHWMLPGGGLETGESREDCCTRELAEETGLLVRPLRHFLTIHEYYGDCLYTSFYFICEVTGQTERTLTPREAELGLEPRWLPLAEAIAIFSRHSDCTSQEEKRGMYLREYQALTEYQNTMS